MHYDRSVTGAAPPRGDRRGTSALRWWLAFWCVAVGAAWTVSAAKDREPGPQTAAPSRLPAAWAERLPGDGPLAVVAVHPRCPCTPAALEQLAAACREQPALRVALICRQPECGTPWNLPPSLGSLPGPGVRVVEDRGGRLAAELGLHASGAVALYDRRGVRVFSGGLTAGRSAHGPSASADAFRAAAAGRPAAEAFPVYGCPINASAACAAEAECFSAAPAERGDR